jgi:hypothetical protein
VFDLNGKSWEGGWAWNSENLFFVLAEGSKRGEWHLIAAGIAADAWGRWIQAAPKNPQVNPPPVKNFCFEPSSI